MPITEVYKTHEVEPTLRLTERGKKVMKGLGAGAAALAVSVGAFNIAEAQGNISFSENVQEWTAQPGEGLLDAANEVEGVESVDYREVVSEIEAMNQESLEDGLQPGETLTIPESVED